MDDLRPLCVSLLQLNPDWLKFSGGCQSVCVMDEQQRRIRDRVSVSSDGLESFEFGFRSVRSRNTSRSGAVASLTYRTLPTFHVLFCGEEPRQKIH